MNSAQAKAIPLKDLLARLGRAPHHEAGGTLWYLSPFREETAPSFKLTITGRGWYDHGRGEGGNILDFAMAYWNLPTVAEALRRLDREWHSIGPQPLVGTASSAPSARPATAPERTAADEREPLTAVRVQSLTNPALLGYLRSRGIAPDVARPYVREIHYTRAGKAYFALAFANSGGGHELRNPYFKGTHGPKGITCIDLGGGAAREGPTGVFEGFMDFLTALTVKALPEAATRVLVLNSAAMKGRALAVLRERCGPVALYLDHDVTGRALTAYFKGQLPGRHVLDRADLYVGYNDFNDLLIARQSRRR